VSRLRQRLAESSGALRAVFANPDLRRLELAWAGAITGKWAYGVALVVYAYDAGGPAAVGLLGLVRFGAAALTAPFVALLADRYERRAVMVGADLMRVLTLGVAGVVALADGPALLVYALAVVTTVAAAAFRPAQGAVLPSLARTPAELTAANVASSTIESVGIFVGPALGGLLLAATGPGVVFVATAGAFLWSALLVLRLSAGAAAAAEARPAAGIVRESLAGFRAVGSDANVALLVGLYASQTFVDGILGVLVVVMALELLDVGEAGVGFLTSAIGVGGLVGALVTFALVGRTRLAGPFGLSLVFWGLPLALIGLWAEPAAALLLLGVLGAANTVVDVAGMTLLQRAVNDQVLARVFGVLESLIVLSVGLGAAVAPLLIEGLGTRRALLVTGAILPVLAALTWRRLAAIDAVSAPPAAELALLRALPLFAPLPAETIEPLAARLVRTALPAGTVVFRAGDRGDRFYVVAEGTVDATLDGRVEPLGAGEGFGEIALLRDVPRTATVAARTDVVLYALEREDFIAAVTGHPESAEAAEGLVSARLRLSSA
jgi:predicted MFS family arabinose efflux permease